MRRVIVGVLIVFGVVLMLAAAETVSGSVLIAIGVVIEIIGFSLERRNRRMG
jgi:hypothetical protein